jgi:diadenosine tetraphosphatase ApaH/serine/threonine PP2A family protein phosphatase
MKSISRVSQAQGERLFAVGDVHGCYQELIELEGKIAKSCARAGSRSWRIFSVGDLCDRGPRTREVLEHFANGRRSGSHELIMGNHESFFLLAFSGLRPDLVRKSGAEPAWFHKVIFQIFAPLRSRVETWRQNGGAEVFRSYNADIEKPATWDLIPLDHIRLLFSAPLVIKTPKCVLTHAMATAADLEILEACDAGEMDISVPEVGDAVSRILWARKETHAPILDGHRHVSGHTPMDAVLRSRASLSVQIDTGAVYGNKLTALDLNSLRTIQVQSRVNIKSGSPQ